MYTTQLDLFPATLGQARRNKLVDFLGLMEDDLWNNSDVTEPSFDIAYEIINEVRRRMLEGKIVEKDLNKGDYSKLVAVLSYMRECRMDLPPPYKEYAKQWEAIARELVTA